MVEGELKGKTLGLLEGENKAKIAMAKAMLKKAATREFVAEVTGLSLRELQEL